MEATIDLKFNGKPVIVSRCGYTGEDGFEVSVINSDIEAFMEKLWKIKDNKTNETKKIVSKPNCKHFISMLLFLIQ